MKSGRDKPPKVRIRSRLDIVGVNPYVLVSKREAALLKKNWHGPMPVRYSVGDDPAQVWRINMMPLVDGSYRLYLNGVVRKASDLNVGDQPVLLVEFDDEYKGGPQHPMPPWFESELAKKPGARRGWEALSPGRQKEILRYLAGLKSKEAKRRNVKKALTVLAGGKGRYMGRSWNDDSSWRGQTRRSKS